MNKTKQAMLATTISIFSMLFVGILTILRTGLIVKNISSDVNALSQISNQLFSYLVLLESGLGSAYTFKMYKPLSKLQYDKVYSLFLGLKYTLKKIAKKMFLCIIILALVYPLFIHNNSLSYFEMGMILFLLGIRFVFPYYSYVAKKNLLITVEKKYIVEIIDGILNIFVLIFEIVSILLGVPIMLIFALSILFYLVINKVYDITLNKACGKIIKNDNKPSFEGEKMTKDIIVHQISSLVFSNTDTILLSIFKSLNSVTIYNAYLNLISYPIVIMNKLSTAISASFGLKLVDEEERVYNVYNEVLSIVFFVDIIATSTFMLMANKFVTLWIGEQYLLDNLSLFFFALLLFHRIVMPFVYTIRNGKGMYKESKKYTLAQAICNLVLSLILIVPFGISGILFATFVSTYFILEPFNYIIVYKQIFKKKLYIYFDMLKSLIAIIISVLLSCFFIKTLSMTTITWGSFFTETLICISVSIVIAFVCQMTTNRYFKNGLLRILRVFKH